MTTSVPPKTETGTLEEPSFPIGHVTDLLKAFVKAVRAHQLYLPNNPMHSRSLEAVGGEFADWIVASQRLEPEVLNRHGFVFEHGDLPGAVRWLLG